MKGDSTNSGRKDLVNLTVHLLFLYFLKHDKHFCGRLIINWFRASLIDARNWLKTAEGLNSKGFLWISTEIYKYKHSKLGGYKRPFQN